jgi:16S rRNA (uracil1498-N3)-methyltransferase
LGITNFVIFQSSRSIAKGAKLDRWNKIARAAMKQSLRSYLPEITYLDKFEKLNDLQGVKVLFEQNAKIPLSDYLSTLNNNPANNYYFIFGPEGGLSDDELSSIDDAVLLKLNDNRLRSETAVVTTASLLITNIK